MKKYFGKYALFFVSIFLLTIFSSCEKDEEFSNESLSIIKPSNKSSSTYRYKNASEIPEVFNVFTAKLKNAKSTFDQELDIDYHRIMEINTIQGGKTYSILMNKADNQDKSSFYNLVIKKDAQGNVNTPFIVKYTTNIAPHLITAEDYNNVQWNTQVMSVDAFMGVQSKSSDCIDPPTVPNTINNISFEYTGPMSPYFNNPSSTSGPSGSSIPRTGTLTICTTQIKTVSYHCNGPNSTEPHPPGPNGGEEGDNSCGDASSGHSGTGTQQVIAINCIDVNIAVEPIPGTHDSAGNRIYNITSIILDGTTSICQAYEIYKHMLDNRDTLDAMGKSMVSAFEEETFIPTMGSTCNGTIRGSDSDITLNGSPSGRSEQIQKSSTSDCPDLDNTGINIPTIVHNLINELNTFGLNYLPLTNQQKQWLEDPKNIKEAEALSKFVKENGTSDEIKNTSKDMIDLLDTGNPLEKQFVTDLLSAINTNTAFDISQYLNPNAQPLSVGPTVNCCTGEHDYTDGLPLDELWEYGPGLLRGLTDGAWNILLRLHEWNSSDTLEGQIVRKVMELRDIDVPEDIENETLGELFQVSSDAGTFIIKHESGIGSDLLEIGISLLDVLAVISPSKGGGAFLAINGGEKVTKASFRQYLNLLKDSYFRPIGDMLGKRIGHTFSKHGLHNTQQLKAISKNSGMPQGQWLNEIEAEKFIARHLNQLNNGTRDIPIPESIQGIGRVFRGGDGIIVNPTHIRLVPSGSGVLTAFPVNETTDILKPLGIFVP